MDPDQCLARRGYRVWQFTEFDAVDPAQLLCQRCSHGSGLLGKCRCRHRVAAHYG